LTLRSSVDDLPKEQDEATFVDGASPWQVITEVVFPRCRPSLAVTLILTWALACNEYLLAATSSKFSARKLTTGLSEYVTTTGTEWGIMAAISVFTLIPALIVFGLVQRPIVAGPTFGAVKG
jgi:multiple sugar transport system permease protein